jgi:hypothetical protein
MLGHGYTFASGVELQSLLTTESKTSSSARQKRRLAIRSKAKGVWGIESVVALYDKVYGS